MNKVFDKKISFMSLIKKTLSILITLLVLTILKIQDVYSRCSVYTKNTKLYHWLALNLVRIKIVFLGRKVIYKFLMSRFNILDASVQKKGYSIKWIMNAGGQHFRLSYTDLFPKWENDKYPYAQFFKGNDYYDINKNKVPLESNGSHVKIDDLTDEFLDWFFQ